MRFPMPESSPVRHSSPLWSGLPASGRHWADPAAADPAEPAAPPAEPEIRCAHCDVPIRRWWIHSGPGGTFQCRDEYGQVRDRQYATPAGPRTA